MSLGSWWKGLKNKALEKVMESQLAKLPPEQREVVMAMISENPELFEKIGKEIEDAKKAGTPEIYATMTIMKKYQSQLQNLVSNKDKIIVQKP